LKSSTFECPPLNWLGFRVSDVWRQQRKREGSTIIVFLIMNFLLLNTNNPNTKHSELPHCSLCIQSFK
jgi:hypothetical protein